jgi:hypothetical protein
MLTMRKRKKMMKVGEMGDVPSMAAVALGTMT